MINSNYTIFSFDFSMNKPAMCIYHENKIHFYTWPLSIDDKSEIALKSCNINVHNRKLNSIDKKQYNSCTLVLEHVIRCKDLIEIILNDIIKFINDNNIDKNNVIISSEGLSFASKGDATLNLAAYKQVLLVKLYEYGLTNIKTYSPISIKATAGKSKKGETSKTMMIDAIKDENPNNHKFIYTLIYNSDLLKKKTSYISTIDDLVDAYWCLKTTILKENLQINI